MNKKPCTTPTKQNSLQQAFTLVELLIVIVAIAILAALAYAAYTAISNRALSSTLQSDLSQAAERLDIANNTLIQDVTQTQCQALPTYTGTNEDAIRSVTDNRGGTTRIYRIAKLADNKCWMLDNLKLGSTTGTTTLTPADSNVSSNFTLPQVGDSTLDYDNPRAYGPVPGDTGTDATNYGYLYNWSAATAGETQASITSGNAQHSICAAGWRLPVGGDYNSGIGEFADLDRAFGGTGMSVWSGEANIAQWQHNGPFKGVFAGYWWEGFDAQGDWGDLWSSSADPDWLGVVFGANFDADGVYPGHYGPRSHGFGVRCLLN